MDRPILNVVMHHSASPVDTTVATIDGWHRQRGFDGIGYHWIVRWSETENKFVVEPGRPEWVRGAHCKGHNADTIGICLCGDFEAKQPDAEQLHVAADFTATRCRAYGLNADNVFGHREMRGTKTACPGKHFNLDSFRALVGIALARKKLEDSLS